MGGLGAGGAESPQRFLTGKFLLTYQEKRGKEKRKRDENWEEKKENCKMEGGKLEMEVVKVIESVDDLFFAFHFWKWRKFVFLLLFTFENDENLFWVYQNGKFLLGKNISCWEKNLEKWLWPLRKICLLCPCTFNSDLWYLCCMESHIFCLQSSGAWSSFTKVNPPLWILQPSC